MWGDILMSSVSLIGNSDEKADDTIRHTCFENQNRKCLKCNGSREPLSIICKKCRSKISLDHKIDLDSPFLLCCLCLVASFSILFMGDGSPLLSDDHQGSLKDISYVLAMISFAVALSLLLLSRDQLFQKGFYVALVAIISPSLITFSIMIVFIYHHSPVAVLFSLILSIIAGSAIFFFRSFFNVIPKKHLSLMIGGVVSIYFGFGYSMLNMGNVSRIWFLSGSVILVIGISLILISTILMAKNLSLMQIESVPNVILFISSVLVILPIYIYGERSSDASPLVLSSIILGFTLLVIASGIWIRKRVVDEEIRINTREIKVSLEKCEELMNDRRYYYALQQLDRAIGLNPIDGLGRGKERDNIIIKLKGSNRLDQITFSPDEYELGLNEKGKMLASQGRFQDAVKEFQEAVRRRPDYIETYMNLSMLLISIPGKRRESCKNIGYLFSYKDHYLSCWLEDDLPYRYLKWIEENYMIYQRSIDLKSEILSEMGAKGDIWSYYSLVKD